MTISSVSRHRPRALVTGASRGIGRAIAVRLAMSGYGLTLSGRDLAALESVAAEVGAVSVAPEAGAEAAAEPGVRQAAVCAADMSRPDDVDRLARFQADLDDALDVLVLCAGVGSAGMIADSPLSRAQRQVAVNFLGPLRLVQALLPALRRAAERPPGQTAKIIAIASITGVTSEAGLAAYGASKAALISLCESITVEEAGTGVTASAISPGYVKTDMSAWVQDRIPPDEMITADDVAELAVALCRLSRHAVVPNVVLTRPGRVLWRA
jgi:3-oxoacyl-[acyl-carrier protein] reductase